MFQLRIREHPETGPYVEGLLANKVSSYKDVKVNGSLNDGLKISRCIF